MTNSQNDQNYWFAKVDISVVRDTTLSPTAKYIFTVLCTFADDNRGCWPSNEKVAEVAGLSERTVIRAYKELEARGIISREARFSDNKQTTSYTLIVGYNAECYGGVMDDSRGVSGVSHRTRVTERESKDSLTGEARLPSSAELLTPELPKPGNPEEVHTPEDAPEIMKPTAELFLHKTGRQGLTWEEISALRELSATQFPSRVQKEIDTAVKRFLKRGQPLSELTFGYIAGSLSHQPTRGKKRKLPKTAKPAPVPECTDEQAEAEMAEIAALQAKFDEEARANGF